MNWIKIHRRLKTWEWYKDSNMVHLFIHLLISANFKPSSWRGQVIERGQVVTGRKQLSSQTGISEQKIRTCLNRLKSTNELTIKTTNRFSVITLINYDKYQYIDIKVTNDLTSETPTDNQQVTTSKKNKEGKEVYIPEFTEFLEYALTKKPNIDENRLKLKYESWIENEWSDGNNKKIKSWKTKLLNTIPHIPDSDTPKEVKAVPHYNADREIDTGGN